jgi:hypothetical protein
MGGSETRPFRKSFLKRILIKVAKGYGIVQLPLPRDIFLSPVASQVPLPVQIPGVVEEPTTPFTVIVLPSTLYLTFISYCPEPAEEGVKVPAPLVPLMGSAGEVGAPPTLQVTVFLVGLSTLAWVLISVVWLVFGSTPTPVTVAPIEPFGMTHSDRAGVLVAWAPAIPKESTISKIVKIEIFLCIIHAPFYI